MENEINKECVLSLTNLVIGIRNVNSEKVREYLDKLQTMTEETFPNQARVVIETEFYPVPTLDELIEAKLSHIESEPLEIILLQNAMHVAEERQKYSNQKINDEFFNVLGLDTEGLTMHEILQRLGISEDV